MRVNKHTILTQLSKTATIIRVINSFNCNMTKDIWKRTIHELIKLAFSTAYEHNFYNIGLFI